MKSWMQDNDIETYSTQSKGKYDVNEKLNGTLRNKIKKCINSISDIIWGPYIMDHVIILKYKYHKYIFAKV